MGFNLNNRIFLKLLDFTPKEMQYMLDLARDLKRAKYAGTEVQTMKGKNIAIFGLGDQKGYPENFLDGMGILAEIIEAQGGRLVGFTSTEGYYYESSRAERGEQFCGLGIDYETQGSKNKERVNAWVEKLKLEFR